MVPAIFLDRDGVIIENRPAYVRSWADVEIFPQALAALAGVKNRGYIIAVVTNQAGIGKGLIQPEAAQEINRRLVQEVEKAGGRIDGIFVCPHTPEDRCDCRKPRPGLFFQAAKALSIDLSRSIMIGDTLNDLQAGRAAGIERVALVRTGLGAQQLRFPEASSLGPFPVYDTVSEALAELI
jgi:D-glycero-D-manno-heptose 1,7-bisphosphate phosphatase